MKDDDRDEDKRRATRLVLDRRSRFIAAAVASAGLAACGKTGSTEDNGTPRPCLSVDTRIYDAGPPPAITPPPSASSSASPSASASASALPPSSSRSSSVSATALPPTSALRPQPSPKPCLSCFPGPGENCDLPFKIDDRK